MSRRSTNFPPGLWQARREYGRHRYNINDSDRANPSPPHSHSFQNSYRERDPFPWRPAGEAMIARILDMGSAPEETHTIVRIITRSGPVQLESSSRPAEPYTPTPRSEGNSTLTSEEQNSALNKLKKKIYDPPKKLGRRMNFYYRENNRRNYTESSSGESDEDGKRCSVCLEDFEPREEVMTTPCNHMFHEQCIVPWAKSNGQCPVCRFALFDRTRRRADSFNNAAAASNVLTSNNLPDDELVDIIRAMQDAFVLRNLAGFWGSLN